MEIRRTLEPVNITRALKASELRVGFCVVLTDTDRNTDTLFVTGITEKEIVFSDQKQGCISYEVVLIRERDKLRDAKGRAIEVWGKPTQHDIEGKEIT